MKVKESSGSSIEGNEVMYGVFIAGVIVGMVSVYCLGYSRGVSFGAMKAKIELAQQDTQEFGCDTEFPKFNTEGENKITVSGRDI